MHITKKHRKSIYTREQLTKTASLFTGHSECSVPVVRDTLHIDKAAISQRSKGDYEINADALDIVDGEIKTYKQV
jgi:hypothetical protein